MRNEALLRQTHFLYASELPHNFFERGQKNKFFKSVSIAAGFVLKFFVI